MFNAGLLVDQPSLGTDVLVEFAKYCVTDVTLELEYVNNTSGIVLVIVPSEYVILL
ncbi:hypothetical protein [Megamonas funiformis]|uniref:hypothetical protein n=1 Tax=Megamonas funiformis TaxID=437897 RepID=UPI002F93AB59